MATRSTRPTSRRSGSHPGFPAWRRIPLRRRHRRRKHERGLPGGGACRPPVYSARARVGCGRGRGPRRPRRDRSQGGWAPGSDRDPRARRAPGGSCGVCNRAGLDRDREVRELTRRRPPGPASGGDRGRAPGPDRRGDGGDSRRTAQRRPRSGSGDATRLARCHGRRGVRDRAGSICERRRRRGIAASAPPGVAGGAACQRRGVRVPCTQVGLRFERGRGRDLCPARVSRAIGHARRIDRRSRRRTRVRARPR